MNFPIGDMDKISRTIHVGGIQGLGEELHEEDVAAFFAAHGEVTAVRISGRFVWVEFADARAAASALRADGEVSGGHHLRVSQSKSAIHSNGLRRRAAPPAGMPVAATTAGDSAQSVIDAAAAKHAPAGAYGHPPPPAYYPPYAYPGYGHPPPAPLPPRRPARIAADGRRAALSPVSPVWGVPGLWGVRCWLRRTTTTTAAAARWMATLRSHTTAATTTATTTGSSRGVWDRRIRQWPRVLIVRARISAQI